LASGSPDFTVVNLIGFNSLEWVIAYFGSILARCLPVGIYSTNSETACHYIATHSEAKFVIAENNEYAEKYYALLGKGIDRIVLYG
jgi:long-chain-fatty-acid--CoA ligase ACSBG